MKSFKTGKELRRWRRMDMMRLWRNDMRLKSPPTTPPLPPTRPWCEQPFSSVNAPCCCRLPCSWYATRLTPLPLFHCMLYFLNDWSTQSRGGKGKWNWTASKFFIFCFYLHERWKILKRVRHFLWIFIFFHSYTAKVTYTATCRSVLVRLSHIPIVYRFCYCRTSNLIHLLSQFCQI